MNESVKNFFKRRETSCDDTLDVFHRPALSSFVSVLCLDSWVGIPQNKRWLWTKGHYEHQWSHLHYNHQSQLLSCVLRTQCKDKEWYTFCFLLTNLSNFYYSQCLIFVYGFYILVYQSSVILFEEIQVRSFWGLYSMVTSL